MILKGKVAVITGCNRGIGKAILENFARNGADVFAVVRKESEEFSDYIDGLKREYSVSIIPIYIELSDEESIREGAKAILGYKDENGQKKAVDILVNNAGITRDGLLMRMKEEDWDAVINTNLKGVFYCTKAVSKLMMKKRYGRIVNMASVVGLTGNA